MGALSKHKAAAEADRAPRVAQAPPPPPDPIASAKDQIKQLKSLSLEKRAPQNYAEVRRVCGLPIQYRFTKEEIDAFSKQELLAEAYENGTRLREHQCSALFAYDNFSGPTCPIGVGGGKTLISIMIAERGYRAGIERSVLLVPPNVYSQLTHPKSGQIRLARSWVPLTVPFHLMHKIGAERRKALARSKWKGCYILPYSLLSTKDTSEVLNEIAPGLIIADEAHRLRNRLGNARTPRVMNYIERNSPKLVIMSGTLTKSSIKDYWHLIRASLGRYCPLPVSSQMADEWGLVLDSKPTSANGSRAELRPLVEWARAKFPDEDIPDDLSGFRHAYALRLSTCPGVVTSPENMIGTSLIYHNEPVVLDKSKPKHDELLRHIAKIDQEFVTPNGDEIEHAIHAYKWRYELTAGFYNMLYWDEEKYPASLLERSKEYHARENDYHHVLRNWIKTYGRDGLDTPLLVAGEMTRTGSKVVGIDDCPCGLCPLRLYEAWEAKKKADFEGRIVRSHKAVRVCDYKIAAAVKWAKDLPKKTGALVWYYHKAIGVWLVEAMKAAGLDVVHCPAGENERVMDPRNWRKVMVLSFAHSEGKNLHKVEENRKDEFPDLPGFAHNYIVQWPRSATTAEQLVGRTHRDGQAAEELIIERNDSTPFDHENFAACLNDSVYIHQTGSPQKLVYGTYDPVPQTYSPEFLREQGFQAKRLNTEQRRLMAERFGAPQS
jgi:hypothetical protein